MSLRATAELPVLGQDVGLAGLRQRSYLPAEHPATFVNRVHEVDEFGLAAWPQVCLGSGEQFKGVNKSVEGTLLVIKPVYDDR